jgi:DNA-binding response OmpR family regulator
MDTILCIDDDPRALQSEKALLETVGYRVLIAADGATGIDISRKQAVDVIVLDLDMAGMDGNQVADVLTKEQPHLPVAIVSGSPDVLPESLKWFADAVVRKGDGPDALLLAVERLARRSPDKKAANPQTVQTVEQRIA